MPSYTNMLNEADTKLGHAKDYEKQAEEATDVESKARLYRLGSYDAEAAVTIARAVFTLTKPNSPVSEKALALAHMAEEHQGWFKHCAKRVEADAKTAA